MYTCENIKTKITVNVNIFIIVLMNCISPWVFLFFNLSKMYKLNVKNTEPDSLNKFDKVSWEWQATERAVLRFHLPLNIKSRLYDPGTLVSH